MMTCDKSGAETMFPTILVVEDEELVRQTISEYLGDMPYNVLQAASGEEALGFIKHHHVDLVFTDVRMPGSINGIELAEMICAKWPGLRVVLTSGYTGPPCNALEGVPKIPFVSKPYALKTVHSVIEHALANSPERQ